MLKSVASWIIFIISVEKKQVQKLSWKNTAPSCLFYFQWEMILFW